MRTESGPVIRLEDYKPTDFIIETVDMTFRLDEQATKVTTRLGMRRREGVAADAPLVLDGDELELTGLHLDDNALENGAYDVTPERLAVYNLPESSAFELEIKTTINPTANTKLMGLFRTGGNYCTQCEAEGFRRITYFLDRPDVLAVYTVRIEAHKQHNPILLSNGNRVESGELDDDWHFAVWHDPHPKPSYLFALVAGSLGKVDQDFTTKSGHLVKLEIYVEHGKEARATYAMDALVRSMKWDEEVFGLEYDLDVFMIVAVPDFNMGAMENKGLNIFNDKYVLADPQTATDADYANIEAIIAHEYFHNWTGNRVTCRDWFQLCLKEGLTVFRDHEFSADQRDRTVKRIAEVRLLRAHQFPEDAGPLAHPVRPKAFREINNFYTATVYEKGSEVVRMLRTILGNDAFRAALDLYFERHDGQAATIEQFLECFADVSGHDLKQFALWYEQAGTPNVAISTSYDPKTERFFITARQSLKLALEDAPTAPMHIPLAFGLVGSDGSDLTYKTVKGADVRDGVIHLTKPVHEVRFEGVKEKPTLSSFRGFSAPVTTIPEPDDEDLVFLAHNDRDGFCRWQTLYTLMMRELKALAANDRQQKTGQNRQAMLDALMDVAIDETHNHAYRALCLTVPGEQDVAREIGENIDPDAIRAAVLELTNAIAQRGERIFARLFHSLEPRDAFSPDAESAGRRALRNVSMTYLCHATASTEHARAVLATADNMTDRAHTLTTMAHLSPYSDETAEALKDFATQFRNDASVIDKWFAIQATIPAAETVERVSELANDHRFSWSNPNRVRSLIGSFATGNPVAFNRVDGAGFEFLCQSVARLDQMNPQVAARLMTAMRSWKSLENNRRQSALSSLRSLASRDHLSRDLRDIVDRIIA